MAWGLALGSWTTTALADNAAAGSSPVDESGGASPWTLKVGERVPAFYVRAVTGPLQNQSVCYACRHGDRPVVMVLARSVSPALAELLKQMDDVLDRSRAKGLRAFGVFADSPAPGVLSQVQTLAFEKQIALPLTLAAVSEDEPPPADKSEAGCISVVFYRARLVTARIDCDVRTLTPEKIQNILEKIRDHAGEGTTPE